MTLKEQVDRFRKRLITSELIRCRGNLSATARSLGLHRNNLARWVQILDIKYDGKRYVGGFRPGANRHWTIELEEKTSIKLLKEKKIK